MSRSVSSTARKHSPSRTGSRTGLRAGATALAVATLTLAGGTAAQAHVRVIPESTAGGAFTKMTFRVPNESDTASTTSLVVDLPTDTPLAFVSAQQLDGWTVKITTSKLARPVTVEGTSLTEAPSKVTWTAEKGQEIKPGQFQEFSLSGGPLPTGVKTLSFPAVQTYSDGTVSNWNEPQAEGAQEPEHPMPSFALTAALPEGADADGDAAAPAAAAPAADSASGAASESVDSDGTARGLGIAGLVAGLLGLGFGFLAWRKAAGSGSARFSGASGSGGPAGSASSGSASSGSVTAGRAGTQA